MMNHQQDMKLLALFIPVFIAGCNTDEQVQNDVATLPVDTLQIAFEIGEEIGDSTNTFCSIAEADIDAQGRLFVVDEVDASVKAYDLQGNYIQQVTRRGNGPGELHHPRGLCIMPDGRIVINAPSKDGYVVFNDSLEFVEEVSLWRNNSPYHVAPLTNGKLVASSYGGNPDTEAEWQYAAIYNWGEAEWETMLWVDSVVITESEWMSDPSESIIFTLFHKLCPYGDGNGNVYLGLVDEFKYRVVGWDSTGTEILNISRDMAPVEKSPDEIASEAEYMSYVWHTMGGSSPSFEIHPSIYENMISDVGIGPDENLWVRRGTRNDLFFDIYDLEGNLLRHSVFPVESWSWKTNVTPNGILAWEEDPFSGYQVLYLLNE